MNAYSEAVTRANTIRRLINEVADSTGRALTEDERILCGAIHRALTGLNLDWKDKTALAKAQLTALYM